MPDVDPVQDILRFFTDDHLPEGPLRETSKAWAELAHRMVADLPAGAPQLAVGLQRLLDARDAFVRAGLPGVEEPGPDPTSAAPGELYGLAGWHLTTPEPGAQTVKDLHHYTREWFHLDGTEIVFRVPAGGGTTRKSDNPRCELRERTLDGKLAAWSTTKGTHQLTVDVAVTAVPPVKPQVVVAQIHDPDDDVVEVMYDGLKPGGALVLRYDDTEHSVLRAPYVLGTYVTVQLVAADGVISVHLDGQLVDEVQHRATGCYFRTGNYLQSNPSRGERRDAVGEVRMRTEPAVVHTAA